MKKFLSTLFSTLQGEVRKGLLFFALLATTTLWAHDFSVNGIYYNYLDGNNVAVTYKGSSYYEYSNEYSGEVIIPETVTYRGTTYSVTSIGDEAFYDCSSLTSITIPNSVTSIGDWAFRRCSSLTSVTIPNSVMSIGYAAFNVCSSLTSITIPNSVTSIGGGAFSYCSSLTSINIPNSVTSIGERAFYSTSIYNNESNWVNDVLYIDNCLIEAKTSISGIYAINDNTQVIAGRAFSLCSSLTSITIPNSVTGIGTLAFESCSSLTSIIIPNSVTNIGKYPLWGCSSLTSIVVENGNTTYDSRENCNAIIETATNALINGCRNTFIPNSVTSIGDNAFCQCTALTSITIPEGVTSIGYGAFYGCSSLTSITIPNSVTSIREYAFSSCRSLTSITIGNSVTSIGNHAFSSCRSLTSITIPNSVTSIGNNAFSYCSSLTSIVWNVKQWTNPNNYSPFSDIKTNITSFTFGNDVEQIPAYICFGMEKLNAVNIPNATTSIGENAFAGCTKLYDVYCYGMEPPMAEQSSFANYNAFLHVPCDNQRVYLLDVVFGNFKYVDCIEAETTPTDTVVVTPSFNDAEFIWPSNSSADSYTLAISKDGEVFCTLTFNANGQLTGIAFAPSRNGQHNAPAAAQMANGFAFTVTGLDEGANYTYDLLIQDRSGNTLQSYSGEFRTQSTNDRTVTVEYDAAQGQVTGAGTYLVGDTVTLTAIPNDGYRFVRWSNEVEDNPYTFVISDNVTLSAEFEAVIPSSLENTNSQSPMSNYQKIIRDGQLLILRDGKTYTVMGAEIQ